MLEKFGCISVVSKSHNVITKGGHSILHYNCVCDCGRNFKAPRYYFSKNREFCSNECDFYFDKTSIINNKFGYLTVVSEVSPHISKGGNKFKRFLCKCDCGTYKKVTRVKLVSGHVKSCGFCDLLSNKKKMIGKKFDKLLVISEAEPIVCPNGDRVFRWNCLCDCGNTTTVIGQSLRLKGNHNCGCYRNLDKIKDVDMIGKRFGRLVVTSRISPKYSSNNTKIHRWKCICDCGNTFNAVGTQLLNGHIKSCGCGSRPYFEDFFINYFNKNEICFDYQKQFDDLIGVGGGKLSYDFFVHFDNFHFLLELQGGQHFKPVKYFGGNDKFVKQLTHDNLKFDYAVKHNLPLLCIKTDNRTDVSVLSEFNSFIQSFTKKESSV